MTLPTAPDHLSAEAGAMWDRTVADFVLEDHDLVRLRVALEAWDRMTGARRILDAEGLVFFDRFGQPKQRPETNVERDARTAFLRAWRELGLDVHEPADYRPPSIVGSGGRRAG
jgi:P27 family predicted phage terminase small subunit